MMAFKFPSWRWIANGIRIFAPIPLTLSAAALVGILWKGSWPIETAELRIQFLGLGMLVVLALLGLALFLSREGISSISLTGPGGIGMSVNKKDKEDE